MGADGERCRRKCGEYVMNYHSFHNEDGHAFGSFEIFQEDKDQRIYDPFLKDNWFWWSCLPGCLPDGDKTGPFKTWKEAFNDADPGALFGLQLDALTSCDFRGHSMVPWIDVKDNVSSSVCSKCRKEVTCTVHPQPNEIDIGGEAVALNCK
jgi:hypothetical protein